MSDSKPFATPVRVEYSGRHQSGSPVRFLLAADHELILSTYDVSDAELAYIVTAINAYVPVPAPVASQARTVIAVSDLPNGYRVEWVYDTEIKRHIVTYGEDDAKEFRLYVEAQREFNECMSHAWTTHAISAGIY